MKMEKNGNQTEKEYVVKRGRKGKGERVNDFYSSDQR